MALLEICKYPDPVLRQKASPIKLIDREVLRLVDDMAETMYDAPGVGLAANQVGKPVRLILVDPQREGCPKGLIVLINPEIVSASGEITWEEGCLSVPEYYAAVKRPGEITVRGLDRDGREIEITASGFLAVVLQHEMDHLEGKLFIDHLNPVARDIFKRRWKKTHKEGKS